MLLKTTDNVLSCNLFGQLSLYSDILPPSSPHLQSDDTLPHTREAMGQLAGPDAGLQTKVAVPDGQKAFAGQVAAPRRLDAQSSCADTLVPERQFIYSIDKIE